MKERFGMQARDMMWNPGMRDVECMPPFQMDCHDYAVTDLDAYGSLGSTQRATSDSRGQGDWLAGLLMRPTTYH